MKLALLGRQALMGVMAVALVAGMSAKSFADEGLLNKVKERGTLLVGLEGTYPPFSFQGDDGKLTGFEVDFAEALAKHLGVKASLKPTKWDGMLASLDSKRIDVVINQVTISDVRKKKYDFSTPYTVSGVQALVKKGNEGTIKTAADLQGKKVGVGLGTNYEEWLRQHVQGVDIRTYDDDPTKYQDLRVGRIDAILVDRLAAVLKLPAIKRMECFDISHTMGEQTVASCVVFDANGPLRAEYRRYNIAGITPGDDYAAMNQVLRRRYGKAIEESKIPDVILIDGGKGQLAQAKAVFAELDVPWDKHRPLLLGVAKGADRKAGLEILFFEPEGEGFSLPPDSPALHVIQHIRDESHDHAIGGHRKKRAKVKNTSTLETIEGVGPKRRQMLLKYMGGLQGLRNASVEEIAKVPGISQGLAEKIFWSLKH